MADRVSKFNVNLYFYFNFGCKSENVMLWQWIWIIQTLVSHEKTEALFRYYIWHIKMEVSKHCVVCNATLHFFADTYGDKICFDSET